MRWLSESDCYTEVPLRSVVGTRRVILFHACVSSEMLYIRKVGLKCDDVKISGLDIIHNSIYFIGIITYFLEFLNIIKMYFY